MTFSGAGNSALEVYGHSVTLAGLRGNGTVENTETETGVGNGALIVDNSTNYTFSGTVRNSAGGERIALADEKWQRRFDACRREYGLVQRRPDGQCGNAGLQRRRPAHGHLHACRRHLEHRIAFAIDHFAPGQRRNLSGSGTLCCPYPTAIQAAWSTRPLSVRAG